MKYFFYLLFFISFSASATDTITVWHVFYNKNKIREYSQYNNKNKIVIKINNIKSTDSITVKYFSDVECRDCKITFSVDSQDSSIFESKYYVENNSFTFPLSALISWKKNKKIFKFYVKRYNFKYRPADIESLFEIELR